MLAMGQKIHRPACGRTSGDQVVIGGALLDEGCCEGAQRADGAATRPEIVEHAAHEAIGHALAPHGRVSFDMGDHQRGAIDRVVGDRHDAFVDDEFVTLTFGIVPNNVVDGVAGLDHSASLAGNVNGSVARRP
jgi:hypothetical protein